MSIFSFHIQSAVSALLICPNVKIFYNSKNHIYLNMVIIQRKEFVFLKMFIWVFRIKLQTSGISKMKRLYQQTQCVYYVYLAYSIYIPYQKWVIKYNINKIHLG